MEEKQIKRILKKQIIIGYINIILSLIIVVSLLLWGIMGSAFGFVVLFFFVIILIGAYLQSDKEKNIFIEINKVNSYSPKKALELVNKNLQYCEESKVIHKTDIDGIHFKTTIIRNKVRNTGLANSRVLGTKRQVTNQTNNRKSNSRKLLDKKIEVLYKLKSLLESNTMTKTECDI